MLTIGQLADYVGVTVRAVRHYHQRGLLPEPERDPSGYRRYDAAAVVDLIRIKALADAGVPLARIKEVLSAGPAEFSQAITQIDKALASRIDELREQRRRIAQLAAGDRLFVPAEIADLIERIRDLGIGPRTLQIERDGWILLAARYPDKARTWALLKQAALADPEFQRLYRAYHESYDWDAADPRLGKIADAIVDFTEGHLEELERNDVDPELVSAVPPVDDPVTTSLVLSRTADIPPAWKRIDELCQEKARARGRGPGRDGGGASGPG
jgi:DNA-binding transcriptional MerR regulator